MKKCVRTYHIIMKFELNEIPPQQTLHAIDDFPQVDLFKHCLLFTQLLTALLLKVVERKTFSNL